MDDIGDYSPGYYKWLDNPKDVTHTNDDLMKHVIPGTHRKIPGQAATNWDWGILPDDWDRDDPAKLQQDTEQANRTIAVLRAEHDRPFFLVCGFYRPHIPWTVPKRYFDRFPPDSIQLPPGHRPDDLEDLPKPGRWIATNRGEHAEVVAAGMWKECLQVLSGEARDRGKPVLSTYGRGNQSLRDERFRYIRYRNGDEELYDHRDDPHEWRNLAADPKHGPAKAALAKWLPATDAPDIAPPPLPAMKYASWEDVAFEK